MLGGLATIAVKDDMLTIEINGTTIALQKYKDNFYLATHPHGGAIVSVYFLEEENGEPCQYITVEGRSRKRIERDPSFIANPLLWTK